MPIIREPMNDLTQATESLTKICRQWRTGGCVAGNVAGFAGIWGRLIVLLTSFSIYVIYKVSLMGTCFPENMEVLLWSISRRSRPAICVRAPRTAAAASARLPASLHARPAAVLPISSARARSNCTYRNAAGYGGIFSDTL